MATKPRAKSRAKSRAKRQMPPGFRRWDAANYLKSEKDMVGYLEAAVEEAPDDPAYITAVLADIARAREIMKGDHATTRKSRRVRRAPP